MADAALFTVNTGCRDQEVCQLRWAWEVEIPELKTSVFILPEIITKTSTERVVVLNAIAQRVIAARRGIDREYVFAHRGKALYRLHNSGWKTAWRKAELPVEKGVLRGVHNLRHTFGRRLRGAGVPLETRKLLLGHASGDITTHYSAAEIRELIEAVEKIADRGVAQTPTLTVISRKSENVGKVSEHNYASQPVIEILLANNRHDFDDFSLNSVIDAVYATHAASIPDSDVFDGRIR